MLDEDRISYCEQHFMMHDSNIKQNTEDISQMKSTLAGLPEKLENMISQIEKLCKAIEKGEERYVTKEMFIMTQRSNEEKFSFVYKAVGAMTMLLVSFFIGHITGKI